MGQSKEAMGAGENAFKLINHYHILMICLW